MFKVLRVFILLLLLPFAVNSSFAEDIVLKEGQSKNITSGQKIDTVFISNPDVADYKVIDGKKIVLYAKKSGTTDLTIYGAKGKVLRTISVSVDTVGGTLTARINKQYPGTNIKIERYMSGEKR